MTVINTAPEVTSVTLSPSTVYTDDTITSTVTSGDDDGDSISLTYEWYVDGSLVAETGASLDGNTTLTVKEVYLVVTPSDEYESGVSDRSSSVTVNNTIPTAPTLGVVEPDHHLQCMNATVAGNLCQMRNDVFKYLRIP